MFGIVFCILKVFYVYIIKILGGKYRLYVNGIVMELYLLYF